MSNAATPQCCGNCAHGLFKLTHTGRFKRNTPGNCVYVIQWPPLPDSVTRYIGSRYENPPRMFVWPADGTKCPTWELKS